MSGIGSHLAPQFLRTATHEQLVEMLRDLPSQRLQAIITAINAVSRERFGVFPAVSTESGFAFEHRIEETFGIEYMNKNRDQGNIIREVAEIVTPRYEDTAAQLSDHLLSGALKSCMNHAQVTGDGAHAVTQRVREFSERIIAEAVASSVSDLAFEAIKSGKNCCDYDRVDIAWVLSEMADDIKALAVEMEHPRPFQVDASAPVSA